MFVLVVGCFATIAPTANAAGKWSLDDVIFTDSRGNEVTIPGGAKSCAVEVISFTPGNPWTSDPGAMDSTEILGAPDRRPNSNGEALTLGAGGVVVLRFDVYIYDGPGNDIYVFEVGGLVEATKVEVSDDLVNWIFVGNAAGSISGVDMDGKVPLNGKYQYVRLTDLKTSPTGTWPGADIDAVAGINVLPPVTLESIVVTTLPTKLTYTVGAVLDLTGMSVTAIYSDGDTYVLEEGDYTTIPANGVCLTVVGTQTIVVSYTENDVTKTDSFEITVTANDPVTYSITYVLKGGVNAPGNPDFYTVADLPLSIADPTMAGYSFDGWVVSYSDGRPSIQVLIKSFTMAGGSCDITLTAYWAKDFVKVVDVIPAAEVTKLNGNKNDLTITLTEKLFDGTIITITKTFSINNNAADTYTVGPYTVYVDTKGNTQIRACYIIT